MEVVENKEAWNKYHIESKEKKKTVSCQLSVWQRLLPILDCFDVLSECSGSLWTRMTWC